jgi:hypothetical protein
MTRWHFTTLCVLLFSKETPHMHLSCLPPDIQRRLQPSRCTEATYRICASKLNLPLRADIPSSLETPTVIIRISALTVLMQVESQLVETHSCMMSRILSYWSVYCGGYELCLLSRTPAIPILSLGRSSQIAEMASSLSPNLINALIPSLKHLQTINSNLPPIGLAKPPQARRALSAATESEVDFRGRCLQ